MLKRRKPLKSRKRLNPVSKKHKIELQHYSVQRKAYLLLNPYCGVCEAMATDIHHKARRGANLNNEKTWMSLCRGCHTKIHDNPKWAKENGYLI